jgi:XRE family transcriptional regulator, regulator of sulfur utilization
MNIGDTIRQLRKQKGLKQNELASLCKISQTYLSLIENNSKEPNISTLKKISDMLSIPISVLFFLSLDKKDVNSNKMEIYDKFYPTIKNLIHEIFL